MIKKFGFVSLFPLIFFVSCSDVDYLEASDHILFSPGAISFNNGLYGKSVEVDYSSKEVIFEATFTLPTAFFNLIKFHRTERLSLYPD